MTREEIFDQIVAFMVENLELERSAITLTARFQEDLDLDSIDAIDLAMVLREMTGKQIEEKDLRELATVADVVDLVERLRSED
ncbi:MAG: acyl carrier protein [Myxococcales bacterium]|nr:acyl carrier protein [Myxococcales bacterium]